MQGISQKCSNCGTEGVKLYLPNGVCGGCLVQKYTLVQALAANCGCAHEAIKKMYQR